MGKTSIFSKPDPKGRRRKGAIYVRVSDTTGREETLISPEIQIGHCQRYADSENIEVVKVESDLNLSGGSFKRRKIARMIDEVKQGQYEVIIVWKWSRWGRNLQESMINMALLDEVGGDLYAATEPVDVTTPTGVFARTQFLAMAQLQLDQIREGWRDAHRNRLEKGLPHSGGPRFGYEYRKDERDPSAKYVAHPLEAPLLREMYLSYIQGRSHRLIARSLNARGFTGRTGAKWTPCTVRQVLDSGFGAGRITYGEHYEAFSTNWEPVLSRDEWEAYQSRRMDVVSRLPARTSAQSALFKGLVYCAVCGRRFNLTRNNFLKGGKRYSYEYWRCNGTIDQRCKGVTIADSVVREYCIGWLRHTVEGAGTAPAMLERKLRADRAVAQSDQIEKQISQVEALRKKGVALVIKGVLTEEDFKEQREEYDRQLEELREALRSAAQEASVNALPPTDVFGALLMAIERDMDPDGLNLGLRKVIHRFLISPGKRGTDRIRIIPRWEADPDATTA